MSCLLFCAYFFTFLHLCFANDPIFPIRQPTAEAGFPYPLANVRLMVTFCAAVPAAPS